MAPDLHGRDQFERCYHLLQERLADGHYRPGERIGVTALAADLMISQTPVREVLSRLVGEGLVHDRRGNGYYSVRLDAVEVAGLYSLQLLYLGEALRKPRQPTACSPALTGSQLNAQFMFNCILENGAGPILMEAAGRTYARLRPIIRVEQAVLPGFEDEQEQLQAAFRTGRPTLRRVIARYFRRRVNAATALASAATRPRSIEY